LASILKVCKDKKGIVSDEVEMQKQFFEVFLVFSTKFFFSFSFNQVGGIGMSAERLVIIL